MLGLGESSEEVLAVLRDLRAAGVRVVTIGQYLRPTPAHLPVLRYVPPEEFLMYRDAGLALGFSHVESGPLVRSSYHAAQAL
jgi:lipoic acid synthetase